MRVILGIMLIVLAARCECDWKKNLEEVVKKDRAPLQIVYGSVTTLRTLLSRKEIKEGTYAKYIALEMNTISSFIGCNITTEKEVTEVLEFFVSTDEATSYAERSEGLFTFTNVLLVVAIIACVIVGAALTFKYLFPWLLDLTLVTKITLSYLGACSVLLVAYLLCNEAIRNYVALLGSLALCIAYAYNIASTLREEIAISLVILPVFVAWSMLTLIFQSKLIGFISVIAFVAFLTTFMAYGFAPPTTPPFVHGAITSGILLLIYILSALSLIPMKAGIRTNFELFEPGIFIVGSAVYFVCLLVMSSSYYTESVGEIVVATAIELVSAICIFILGCFFTSELGILRSVASVFGVAFVLAKWTEIRWGQYYLFGIFGAAIFIVGLCFLIKSFPEFFFFA